MASITLEGPGGSSLVLDTLSVPMGVQGTRTLTAGAGLTGGGDLSADRSFAVGANADGSIVVNANDIQVGILATDAQHGHLGGGALHAVATTGTAGFLSAADKVILDGMHAYADAGDATILATVGARTITAGAGLTGGGDLSASRTLNVIANADASIVVNANDIQVGVLASDAQHGTRGGGTQHASVVAAGASGFMTGADKTKLDGIAASAAALTSSTPTGTAFGATGSAGSASTAAKADHTHGFGAQTQPILFTGPLASVGKKMIEYIPANGPGKFNFLIDSFDNPGDVTRQDHVMRLGWNVAPGGGNEASNESQFSDQWESHWDDGGGFARKERHIKYTLADGSQTRAPFTMAYRTDTYYLGIEFHADYINFGPNTTAAGGNISIYGSGLMTFSGGAQLEIYPNNAQGLKQFNQGGTAYENLIYLDNTGLDVIGGQTSNGLSIGQPLNAGRRQTIFGNDCSASGNQAGGDLVIAGGRGRGTGTSGAVIFATAAAGGSGSAQNALTDRWKIDTNGRLVDIIGGLQIVGRTSTAADPTTTELPADKCVSVHNNTNSGAVYLAYNDSGTIKKVALT